MNEVKEVWKQLEYILTGTSLVIGMDGSLRGHEILLTDLHGTFKNWDPDREEEGGVGSYIISDFLGIFNGKMG